MKTMTVVLVALALSACSGERNAQNEKEYGSFTADPENMPQTRTLYSPVPVVLVRVEASESGYTLRPFSAMGAPTASLIQTGDVLLKALDADGRVLASVAVSNPRVARTAGSKRPEIAVLPSGVFTVMFGKPDSIRNIEVTVLNGPNAGLKQTFPLDPKDLRPVPEDK